MPSNNYDFLREVFSIAFYYRRSGPSYEEVKQAYVWPVLKLGRRCVAFVPSREELLCFFRSIFLQYPYIHVEIGRNCRLTKRRTQELMVQTKTIVCYR